MKQKANKLIHPRKRRYSISSARVASASTRRAKKGYRHTIFRGVHNRGSGESRMRYVLRTGRGTGRTPNPRSKQFSTYPLHVVGSVPRSRLSATAGEEARTINELWHYAEVCRFARVMRPYMESGCVTESRVKNLPASIKARLSKPVM
jgi:hypothetical protein